VAGAADPSAGGPPVSPTVPRAAGPIAAAAALVLLAASGPAAGQEAPGDGFQLHGFGTFLAPTGEVFPWPEKGFGVGGMARYRWPGGISVGAGGRLTFPDAEIPEDGTLHDYTVGEGFAEVAFSPLVSEVVRPFVGLRLGVIDLEREVTLPPDAPVFGERPPWQATGQSGNAFAYGAVLGTELWVSDHVAVRAAGTGSLFSVSGFEALVDGAGRDPGSEALAVEVGVSVSFGGPADTDGDGVPDREDACPDSARGVPVDEDGCAVDADGDGVPDFRDDCSATPAGVAVDEDGCAVDSDDDGVPDGRDACSDTPAGAVVDGDGCAVDSDGDGVPDGIDDCSGTPEGVPVNESGCLRDSDGDGVADDRDACPGTQYLDEVGDEGCSRVQQMLERTGEFTLPGLPLELGAMRLQGPTRQIVNEVGQELAGREGGALEIHVLAAREGRPAYNLQMTQSLADALRDLPPGDGFEELDSVLG
jgi:opacity protein-like surface antigen